MSSSAVGIHGAVLQGYYKQINDTGITSRDTLVGLY